CDLRAFRLCFRKGEKSALASATRNEFKSIHRFGQKKKESSPKGLLSFLVEVARLKELGFARSKVGK
ncbi:MAG: hypothetical protein J6W28_00855, partial [Clostridia bacterium]|nr:hypothetical protein [Clostridia bacterium]